jgi:hypothetical protein
MNNKKEFKKWVLLNLTEKSGAGPAYISSLEWLSEKFYEKGKIDKNSLFEIEDISVISELHREVKRIQRDKDSYIYNEHAPSYGERYFYSASLSKYKEFLEFKNSNQLSSNSIRDFALMVFKHFYNDSWEVILNESQTKNSTINGKEYITYDHEWFNNLIGVFDKPQDKESLTSSKTIRFFEEPILIKDGKYYYFTTQWNGSGEYNLSFKNLKNFIENRFPNYTLIQEGKTFILTLKGNSKPKTPQIIFNSESFQQSCEESGLNYKPELIIRYISSLATKPFVLLSGLSGSGKTKLAQGFAQWIAEDNTQYCIVPVGADWTNREPLLGYINALDNEEYILPENGALKLLIEANKEANKNKPYFLILDEMNLSHVERYFADFLSVMESKDNFKLHSSENNKSNVPSNLCWPKNLFIVGTVNIDETTYMFSPKVLDRANVIEFRVNKDNIVKFLDAPTEIDFNNLNYKGASMGEDFITIASKKTFPTIDTSKLNEKLVLFFEELKKTGAEFGYRSATEIHRLFNQLSTLDIDMAEATKIDITIMQKLLPKLHGSRRKLCPILEVLASLCVKNAKDVSKDFLSNKETLVFHGNDNVLYPLSLEKITRMYKGAIDNGFASYAEA